MVALLLNHEFKKYWLKLSIAEKESSLPVAKNFVELKEDEKDISLEKYNSEIDEAMRRMGNDEFYTHEQGVQILKRQLNGK
jgi:hypothetical protein